MFNPLTLGLIGLLSGGNSQSTSVTSQNANNIGVTTSGVLTVGGSVNPNTSGAIRSDPSASATSVAANTKPDQQGFLNGLNLGGTPRYAAQNAQAVTARPNFIQDNMFLIGGVVAAALGFYAVKG